MTMIELFLSFLVKFAAIAAFIIVVWAVYLKWVLDEFDSEIGE